MIAEYYYGAIIQRFIPGAGTDETVGAFNGSGARTWYYADERGSTVARAGDAGTANLIHSYDEYGRPTGNAPRIGFTGQLMVSFGQLYDFKNRFYHAGLGRFLQPDPIGYGAGMNMYAYVVGDPINLVDPSGLGCSTYKVGGGVTEEGGDIVIQKGRYEQTCLDSGSGYGGGGPTKFFDDSGGGGGGGGIELPPVDRCAAKSTPPITEQSFSVDYGEFSAKAAQKYIEHTWLLNDRWQPHSVFGGKIISPEKLVSAALLLVTTRDAVPAGGLNVRITGDMGFQTGRDIRSPLPSTNYLTVILGPPNGMKDGLPKRPPVSMHPGC